MIITGIDPDLSGGIATLDVDTRTVLEIVRMPVFEHPVTGTRIIDAPAVAHVLARARAQGAVMLVLETASSRPGQGDTTRILTHYGMLLALAQVAFTRPGVVTVPAHKWKKDMGLDSDKGKSRALASEWYPGHKVLLEKVKNSGIAEAMLLAEWGRKNCT